MKSDGIYELPSVPGRDKIEGLSRRVPEADPQHVETYLHMLKASGDFLAALDSHFSRYNLSRGRFFVLMSMFHNEGAPFTPGDIAERLDVSRATITGLLDGLEKERLVERRRFPGDRRKVDVYLTEEGQELLDEILPDHYRRVSALMGGLTRDEQEKLCGLLEKMQEGLAVFRSGGDGGG